MEPVDSKAYCSLVTLDSISAGALRKRGEWNSLFAFAFLAPTRHLRRCFRVRLALPRGLQGRAQLFPQSPVRSEEPEPYCHR